MSAPRRQHRRPFTAERRLPRKLGRQRLFDLLSAQVTAGGRDWRTIHQAVVLLRDQGELAPQRRKHVGPLEGALHPRT